jgi:hypothetical protein
MCNIVVADRKCEICGALYRSLSSLFTMQNIVTTIIIKPTESRYVLIAQSLNVSIATRGSIRTMGKNISRQ